MHITLNGEARMATKGATVLALLEELGYAGKRVAVERNGARSVYYEIDSPHGHDAFLINGDQIAEPLDRFLGDVSKSVI